MLDSLEQLAYRLDDLTRMRRSRSTNYGGLFFKTAGYYMTEERYLLGAVVWFMWVTIDDLEFPVFGPKPEDVYRNAIALFTGYFEREEDQRVADEFINAFREEQRSKADEYFREA